MKLQETFWHFVVLIEKLSQETVPSSTLSLSIENLQCVFSFPLEIRALAHQDGLQIVFFEYWRAAREISSNQMERVLGYRFWESSKKELWACSPGCMECVYTKCTDVVWFTSSKLGISRRVLGVHTWFSFVEKLECNCSLFLPENCLMGMIDMNGPELGFWKHSWGQRETHRHIHINYFDFIWTEIFTFAKEI